MTSQFLGNEGKDIGKDYDKYGVGDEGKDRQGWQGQRQEEKAQMEWEVLRQNGKLKRERA